MGERINQELFVFIEIPGLVADDKLPLESEKREGVWQGRNRKQGWKRAQR
jgi:hypothetical protein